MKVEYYIVVNKEGETYAGMLQGSPCWTLDWNQAKHLKKENTQKLLIHNLGAELIEEKDLT